jgi:hypothetical protein
MWVYQRIKKHIIDIHSCQIPGDDMAKFITNRPNHVSASDRRPGNNRLSRQTEYQSLPTHSDTVLPEHAMGSQVATWLQDRK